MSEKQILKAILVVLVLIFLAIVLPDDLLYTIRYRIAPVFTPKALLTLLLIIILPAGAVIYSIMQEKHEKDDATHASYLDRDDEARR